MRMLSVLVLLLLGISGAVVAADTADKSGQTDRAKAQKERPDDSRASNAAKSETTKADSRERASREEKAAREKTAKEKAKAEEKGKYGQKASKENPYPQTEGGGKDKDNDRGKNKGG
jgi:hypothetical protein